MSTTSSTLDAEVARIRRIPAVPRILDAMIELTGMRFAAVASVTEQSWTACAVRDDLGFGLLPGQQLELESTICNEIRQHQRPVVFGHASADPHYRQHHTPKQYGLESYLSVPIFRADGSFFGTLCAIDSRSSELDDPALLKTIELLAELIGRQLEIEQDLETSRNRLIAAERSSELREQVIAAAERDIRDLFQPIITGVYLLRTSRTINVDDRDIVGQIEECCEQISLRLRGKLDRAYEHMDDHAAGQQAPANA